MLNKVLHTSGQQHKLDHLIYSQLIALGDFIQSPTDHKGQEQTCLALIELKQREDHIIAAVQVLMEDKGIVLWVTLSCCPMHVQRQRPICQLLCACA